MISINLTETEKKNFNHLLDQSQQSLSDIGDDNMLSICYNMDSILNEIDDLSLHDKLDKSQVDQLIISILSIKDRLACE